VVVGDVPAGRPRLALVGEAPGATEDETGRPFVGRSGALLDQLLSEAGLERSDAAVLNVVKCRPPGNRTPRAPEVARCSGWLRRQLELLDPPVVVALGLSSAKWFLGPRTVLAAVRGRPHPVDGRSVWATYHPSAAIRFGPNGAPRAGLAADLAAVAAALEEAR
jgi:DNA polymerase